MRSTSIGPSRTPARKTGVSADSRTASAHKGVGQFQRRSVEFWRVVFRSRRSTDSFTDSGQSDLHNSLLLKQQELEPVAGFEPATDGLQNRSSTTELNWLGGLKR